MPKALLVSLIAVSIIASALLLLVFMAQFNKRALYLWQRLPLVGTITRVSRRDISLSLRNGYIEGFNRIAQSWLKHLSTVSKDSLERNVTYLAKVGDLGQSHSKAIWVLIIVLAVAEGIVLGYVLTPYVLNDVTASQRQMAAWIAGCVISAVQVYMAHAAGNQIKHNAAVRKVISAWKQEGCKYQIDGRKVARNQPQHIDDDQPFYVQQANRMDMRFHHAWIVAFVLFTVAAAGLTTFVRMNEMKANQALLAQQTASFDKTVSDERMITTLELQASTAAYIMLCLSFCMVQLLGLIAGIKNSTVGLESGAAISAQGGKLTIEEIARRNDGVIDLAEECVQTVQFQCREKAMKDFPIRTFREYVNHQFDVMTTGSLQAEMAAEKSINKTMDSVKKA